MVDESNNYSFVEIQPQADRMIPYERRSTALPEYYKACASCRRIGEYVTRLLYQGRRITPQWDIPIKAYREEPSMGPGTLDYLLVTG
ncbi:hypothetical protein ABHI18_000014 [Aspergillus niger]